MNRKAPPFRHQRAGHPHNVHRSGDTIANRAVNAQNYGTVGHPPSSRLFRKEKQ